MLVAKPPVGQASAQFLEGGGDMGERMRAYDWSSSPLGAPETWSVSLRALMRMMLESKQAMFIAWGPQLAFLYNDAYAPILGAKHPAALGRPFAEVWSDIWQQIRPLVDNTLAGHGSWHEDLLIPMERHGYREEAYFSFSYTPAYGDDGTVSGMFCAATETTQKVAAERHLASESDRLKELFQQAPGFMVVFRGPEHVFEMANASYYQLVGHRDIIGKPVLEALPEVADQGFKELLDRVYATGEAFVGRGLPALLQRQPDGTAEQRFVDFVYQPIRGQDGRVTGVFAEGSDVTEAKRAEEALRASEARARGVLEGMREGFLLLDSEYRILQINGEGLRIDGRSAQEIVGHSHWDVWPASVGTPVEAAYVKAMDERVPVTIVHHYLFDDRGIWLELRIFPVTEGGVAAFFRDVTEQQQAAEALRQSEARLKAVLNHVPVGIVIADAPSGQIVAGNPQAERIFRHPIYHSPNLEAYRQWRVHHPDERPAAPHEFPLARAITQGETIENEEYLYRRGDDTFGWIRLAAAPIRNDDGSIIAGVVAIVDTDEEKKAEESLRASESRLRLALDAGQMAVWETVTRGEVSTITTSPELNQLFGFPANANPSIDEFRARYAPGARERLQETAAAAVQRGDRHAEAELEVIWPDGTHHWIQLRADLAVSPWEGGVELKATGVAFEITARKRWEEHQRLLINELNHRVKNTLATVQSIASQSLRGAESTEEARTAMEERLFALSRAHDVLTRENWEGAALHEIVAEAVAPFTTARAGRFHVEGPQVRLSPRMALAIAMALQELSTNAVKYGALSNDAGEVEIHWTVHTETDVPRLVLCWEERGGPPVATPIRRGFGSRLIERSLAQDLGGSVSLNFEPAGLVCTVDARLTSLDEEGVVAA